MLGLSTLSPDSQPSTASAAQSQKEPCFPLQHFMKKTKVESCTCLQNIRSIKNNQKGQHVCLFGEKSGSESQFRVDNMSGGGNSHELNPKAPSCDFRSFSPLTIEFASADLIPQQTVFGLSVSSFQLFLFCFTFRHNWLTQVVNGKGLTVKTYSFISMKVVTHI